MISFDDFFKQTQFLLRKGDLEESSKMIENIKNQKKLNEEEKLSLLNLQLEFYSRKRQNEKAIEIANIIFQECEKNKNNVQKIKALLALANLYIIKRLPEESADVIKKIEKQVGKLSNISEDEIKRIKAKLNFVKGLEKRLLSKHQESIKLYNNAHEIYKEIKDQYGIALALKEVGNSYFYLGNFDDAEKYFNESLALFRNQGIDFEIAKIYDTQAGIFFNKGSLNQALEFAGKSLALFEGLGNKLETASLNHKIGYIYKMSGDNKRALDNYVKSKTYYEKTNQKHDIAKALLDISGVYMDIGDYDQTLAVLKEYHDIKKDLKDEICVAIALRRIGLIQVLKGELENAEQNYEKSLDIALKHEEKEITSNSYFNLGELNFQKGELERAVENHLKALAFREELNKAYLIASSLKSLICVYLELKLKSVSEEYLKKLKEISDKTDNLNIQHYYQLSNALFLKNSGSIRDRNKAEVIFDQLKNDEKADFSIVIESLLNLNELLLWELGQSEDESILGELNENVENLLEMAKKQNSYVLIAETLLLQSILALLDLNVEESKKKMSEALVIADQKGLNKLALKISNELDNLLDQLDMWDEFTKRLPTIAEKLEITHIEDKLNEIIKRRLTTIEVSEEREEAPQMLFILSNAGYLVFSDQFDENLGQDVVEEILSIVKKKTKEQLEEGLERIRIEDYTFLLKKYKELVFCYVFIGKSYNGIQKLKSFTKTLEKKSRLLNELIKISQTQESLGYDKRVEITRIIDEFILKK
jgi:tetratricopeptide (TPR) repeat protein